MIMARRGNWSPDFRSSPLADRLPLPAAPPGPAVPSPSPSSGRTPAISLSAERMLSRKAKASPPTSRSIPPTMARPSHGPRLLLPRGRRGEGLSGAESSPSKSNGVPLERTGAASGGGLIAGGTGRGGGGVLERDRDAGG